MFDLDKLNEEMQWSVYLGTEGYRVTARTAAMALRVALFDYLGAEHWSKRDRAWWLFLDSADIIDTLPESLDIVVVLEDEDVEDVEEGDEGRVLN